MSGGRKGKTADVESNKARRRSGWAEGWDNPGEAMKTFGMFLDLATAGMATERELGPGVAETGGKSNHGCEG